MITSLSYTIVRLSYVFSDQLLMLSFTIIMKKPINKEITELLVVNLIQSRTCTLGPR